MSTAPTTAQRTEGTNEPLLSVQNLSVVYEPVGAEPTHAVRDVSFDVGRGEFLGLVGESGSGKSTLGFALTALAKAPARIENGRVLFGDTDIAHMDREALRTQRQGGFAMVLQAGMNTLNPVRTIRKHFDDIFAAHQHVPAARREERAAELVGRVSLGPEVLDRYPFELSGGMRQRITIALALSLEPQLMVFDEPTTALDVLVQHAVMDTIRALQAEEGFTAILISHDLGVVLESAHRVLVMHDGRIVEDAPSADILRRPQHEYTRMLLSHFADPRAEHVRLPGLEEPEVTGRRSGRTRRRGPSLPPGLPAPAAEPGRRSPTGCSSWSPGSPSATHRRDGPPLRCSPSTTSASRSPPAGRPPWSASPAAGSPRSPA